jgi:octaprenyl-diphosphate synthase
MVSHNHILNKHRVHFERINAELDTVLSSRVPLIEKMGAHSLLGHGKRLRPLIFVLACELCDCQQTQVHRLSTIFEYIHTASLLHDDVLDNAEVRRKKPSANHMWGNHAAVLEGDFLYSTSFAIAVGADNLSFMKKLTDTTTRMAEGQVLELIHTHDWEMSKEAYMDIITAKTAVLISAACACGAILSGREQEWARALERFGLNMGIAFQLMDDLLDYTADQETLGKPVGKDLREGKVTLPLIYTLPQLAQSKREAIKDLFAGGEVADEDYRALIELVRQNGAIGQIRGEAEAFVEAAAEYLAPFPDSPAKENLLEMNRFIIEREY